MDKRTTALDQLSAAYRDGKLPREVELSLRRLIKASKSEDALCDILSDEIDRLDRELNVLVSIRAALFGVV